MNAPATNAAAAIIQSRGCKFLMKSIIASMGRNRPVYCQYNTQPATPQGYEDQISLAGPQKGAVTPV